MWTIKERFAKRQGNLSVKNINFYLFYILSLNTSFCNINRSQCFICTVVEDLIRFVINTVDVMVFHNQIYEEGATEIENKLSNFKGKWHEQFEVMKASSIHISNLDAFIEHMGRAYEGK